GAAGAGLPDPALGWHIAQSAPGRPPRVSRGSVRAEDRLPEEVGLAAARPRTVGYVVRHALLRPHRRAPSPDSPDEEAECGPEHLSVLVPAATAEADLRRVRGGEAAYDRAGRARLLLHILLQRVAGQPQPVSGAE